MFASRLLKVLQTIPADVKYEPCALDTPELKLIMKENQLGVLFHSNRGVDPLSFSMSDLYQKNGSQTDIDTLSSSLEDLDKFWKTGVNKSCESVDNHARSGLAENGDAPVVENQREPFWHTNSCEKITEWLAPATKDNYHIQSSPNVMPAVNTNEGKAKVSVAPSFVSQLLESDVHSYTDKNVVECEVPEFDVSSNVQVVKDICIDTGVAPQERTLIENKQDDAAASFTAQTSGKDLLSKSINGDVNIGVSVSDQSKGSAVKDTRISSASEILESLQLDGSKSSSDGKRCGDMTSKLCTENSSKVDGESKSSLDYIADNVSEDESSISSTRVSEEFMLQDSLLESLKQEQKNAGQQHDEVPSLETILEGLAVVFTSKDGKKDDLVSKLSYNSKVEGGTITFDFKSSKNGFPSKDSHAESVSGISLEAQDEKSKEQPSAVLVQSVSNEETVHESGHEQNSSRQDSPNKEDLIPGNPGPVRVQPFEGPQIQRGEEESSFAAREPVSGLITYSGPIAYSGSISLRSDSSTTSTRSFAFPVLQSEWNSSPVRMHKAERRRMRKQRCWRDGFLCCRF